MVRKATPPGGVQTAKTLTELAAVAGVSVGTVSKALSNRGYVSAATRERICALADEHGFQINRTAQSLKLGRNDAVAVTLPLGHESAQTFSDPFFIALIGHLADAISAQGSELVLSKISAPTHGWLSNITRSGRVDGILVIGQSDQEAELSRVAVNYRPLVVWGQYRAGQNYCSVGTDNFAGGRMAAQRLIDSGRRRLVFAGMTDIPEIAARRDGFIRACEEAGIAPDGQIETHLTADAAYARLAEAVAGDFDADGVVAASDVIAMSAMRALIEQGRRVPEDVAVIGYDDVGLAAFTTPPLTTIRQDLKRAAEAMVDLLFRRIANEEAHSLSLPPELVVRASA